MNQIKSVGSHDQKQTHPVLFAIIATAGVLPLAPVEVWNVGAVVATNVEVVVLISGGLSERCQ